MNGVLIIYSIIMKVSTISTGIVKLNPHLFLYEKNSWTNEIFFKTTIYNLPGNETLNLCLCIAEVVFFSTMRGLEDS